MEMCIDYNYSSMYVWIIVKLNLQFQKSTKHCMSPSMRAFTVGTTTTTGWWWCIAYWMLTLRGTYNVWLIESSGISRTSTLQTYSLNFIARQDICSKCSKCLKIQYWPLAGRGFKFCMNSVISEKLRNSCNIDTSSGGYVYLKGLIVFLWTASTSPLGTRMSVIVLDKTSISGLHRPWQIHVFLSFITYRIARLLIK